LGVILLIPAAAFGGWPGALIVVSLVLWWGGGRHQQNRRKPPPVVNDSAFRNDSGRQHETAPTQTWGGFLGEMRRQTNSGAHVKLGNGFEVGIVGESFHVPELQWVRAQDADANAYRVKFTAYLIPEPENPHRAQGDAVRVESPRGRTIGHLSNEQAAAYTAVFKALHAAKRVGVCRAVALGGTEMKPNIGVWINIGHSAWLAEQLAEANAPKPPRRKKLPVETPPADQPF
jgi:hypothetical protein